MNARDDLEVDRLRTAPLLADGQVRMTESAAICESLAAKYDASGLEVIREPDFGAYLSWLHFGEATLTFPQTLALRYSQWEPEAPRNPLLVEDDTRWLLGRLRAIRRRKGPSTCVRIGSRRLTSVGYALRLATESGLDRHFSPAVARHWSLLQQCEAFIGAKRAQGARRRGRRRSFAADNAGSPTAPARCRDVSRD